MINVHSSFTFQKEGTKNSRQLGHAFFHMHAGFRISEANLLSLYPEQLVTF